jgi:hypothetical protein
MDDLDLDKLEKLVALMRRLGIKTAGSVELWPDTPATVPLVPMTAAEVEALAGGEPPPEDMLLWSVDGPLPSEVSDANRPPEE